MNITDISNEELISLYSNVIKELKNREIIRTKNVLGDIAEFLAINYYCQNSHLPNLQAAPVGTQNIDAISRAGERYSIKATSGTVTGIFTGLQPKGSKEDDKQKFEYVIICKFDDDFHLKAIYEITWENFMNHKRWHSTMKAWNLSLTKNLIADSTIIYLAEDEINNAEVSTQNSIFSE